MPEHLDLERALATVIARADPDARLSAKALSHLLASARTLSVRRGWRFLDRGDEVKELAVVTSGLFKFHLVDRLGHEVITTFATEGRLLMDYAASIRGTTASVAIEAVEDASVAVFPVAVMTELTAIDPGFERTLRLLVESEFANLTNRIYELLSLPPAEAYAAFMRDKLELASRIPRKDLASYLGITPTSLSRLSARRLREAKR